MMIYLSLQALRGLNIIWMAFELQIAGHVIGSELGTFKYCLISREQYESWDGAENSSLLGRKRG